MHREQEAHEGVGEMITHGGKVFEVHLQQIFSTSLSYVHLQLKVQF